MIADTTPDLPDDAVRRALDQAGLPLDPAPTAHLTGFLTRLLRANQELNLTRVTEHEAAIARHGLEALAGWRCLAPLAPPGPLVEAGSGGGAPGIPIAIAAPERPVILLESRQRKAAYLADTVAALDLPNVEVIHERAELYAHAAGRERAAVAIARALARVPATLELLLPLLSIGGLAAIWVGPSIEQELDVAAEAAAAVGGDTPVLTPFTWTGCDRDLRLLTVYKRRPTPAAFPRPLRRIRRALARAATPDRSA